MKKEPSKRDFAGNVPVNLYSETILREFTTDFLQALGTTAAEARIITDGLVTACLWWHPGKGQGLEKLFRFRRRMANGGIRPDAQMVWDREGPSWALLDAAKGFGYVSAHRAMERAIEKARETGVAFVGVHNSNHFGIAGYHASKAARSGLIGLAMTNAGAEMAPTGSSSPVLGTNPWGIAIPRREQFPVLLDMALTMSGKGMMRWHGRAGESIPNNWAMTPKGYPTTNPAAAMDGPLLPIGDYKGYGLSLVTDVLSGVMTGALFGLSVFRDDQNYDVGHLMIAVNPETFIARREFESRLEQLLREVKSAPPLDPKRPVMLPGELEFQRMEQRRREGIPVDRETVRGLLKLSAELGITCPL